ncbi:FecR family protein [Chitinophaga japonensis]|uniref:FecR family protein n=1 Tax=Chitinophaga japonensis TaxID=104662 RepID=A0A562T5H7_CHIJA|nr:FecR domain-containing protein [Chitinophaga japonensis]TWI88785.1 FecR family protein [Chitinophaga japonensis]
MEAGKVKQLLQRYLSGQVSRKETEVVDEWYQSFNDAAGADLSEQEAQQVRAEIWQQVSSQIAVTKTFYLPAWARIAATVLLLAGAALVSYLLISQRNSPVQYTEVRTADGERKTLHMEDGTVLTLNAGTTLLVAKDLSEERRLQLVDGEVFFNVQGDTRRPFIVESGPLVTTVLGTAFNVAAYAGIHTLRIAVASGKVSVTGKTGAAADVLEKGRALVYDRRQDTRRLEPFGEGQPAWMQGRLVLNDVSFDEMAVLVKKNFGITLLARQEQVRESRYTTELQTDMTPAAAVEVLAAIHHLKISGSGNQVTLYQ